MSLRKKMRGTKLNTDGSALLTVILVVSFLTILATTLLYISGMNFQIKQMDYQNKKNFYTGETALEEMRAELMEDASKASVKAYGDVSAQFVALNSGAIRELEYNRAFVAALQEVWANKGLTTFCAGDWNVFLQSYFSDHTHGTLTMADADGNGDGIVTSAEILDIDADAGVIRVRNLKMTYTNEDKLTTIISTDLEVFAPEISWSVEESLGALDVNVPVQTTTVDASRCVGYTNWKKE